MISNIFIIDEIISKNIYKPFDLSIIVHEFTSGIYFITTSIYQLAKHFPTKALDQNLINSFNREIEFMFDDCRDFVQAHYLTSTRDDTAFWLANKNDLFLSDNIKEKMDKYRSGLPINPPLSSEEDYYGSFDNEFHNFWTNGSYYCIFSGMGFLPDRPLGRLSYRPEAVAIQKSLCANTKPTTGIVTHITYNISIPATPSQKKERGSSNECINYKNKPNYIL